MVTFLFHVVLILLRVCGVWAIESNGLDNQNELKPGTGPKINQSSIVIEQASSTDSELLHNNSEIRSVITEAADSTASTSAIQELHDVTDDQTNVKWTNISDTPLVSQVTETALTSTYSAETLENSGNHEYLKVSSTEVNLSETTACSESVSPTITENILTFQEDQSAAVSSVKFSFEHTPTVILEGLPKPFSHDLESSPLLEIQQNTTPDAKERDGSQSGERTLPLFPDIASDNAPIESRLVSKNEETKSEMAYDKTHVKTDSASVYITALKSEEGVHSLSSNQKSSSRSASQAEKSPIADLAGQALDNSVTNTSNISLIEREESLKNNQSEDCRFLSFEEWKKLKENVHSKKVDSENGQTEKKETQTPLRNDSLAVVKKSEKTIPVSFEEQGRVYKDKFNYASVDCAATIVKTNSDAKGAKAILTEVKDSYLLNKCLTENKYVVVELCLDILVGSVVLANFELFSSMFKTVRFSVSDRFPATQGWHELGTYEAQNIRDLQVFDIASPLIWARYLKIEIVSHYGKEFYCPISLVRVHGKTMMEEFKDTLSSEVPEASDIPLPTEEFLNNSAGFESNDECKVTPYLALNEFLKDFHSNSSYCDALSQNVTTSAESSNSKPTQESIFQNIVKRLLLLETNATLSLLYVEEQSKLLSDAFFNLEHRQVKKFENLLTQLNETMYSQVTYLEHAVAKIRIDSKILLGMENLKSLSSIEGFRQETISFAREISFLRKVVIADTLIILALLAYVILTRESFSVDELTGKKQAAEVRAPEILQNTIRPFAGGHNRSRARRRKH